MRFRFLLTLLLGLFSTVSFAQVPKKIVVEHFTNSWCPPCATRNPGFYNNFSNSNNGNMIHLAYHPSSPFPTCIFSAHNTSGNNERTNYYGIFGATPRLVINGTVVPSSTSYNSGSLFAPYLGQTSPVSISITESNVGTDSIKIDVTITTQGTHNLPAQKLFVVLAEDTINYVSPNNEAHHYDVYRRTLYPNITNGINIPTQMGATLTYSETVKIHSAWDVTKIFTTAILQDAISKQVTQAERTTPSLSVISAPNLGVDKNILVEHFSNTECMGCASVNSGFYSNYNMANTGNKNHVVFHTSAPFSSCELSMQNPIENDVRAHNYGVFGDVPRFAVNGDLLPNGTNYSSPSIFQSYEMEMTPFSITASQSQIGFDSIKVEVSVKTEAMNMLGNQNLQVLLVEDTVFYQSPNGESQHYNVFRKMMFDTNGLNFTPAMMEGDSVMYTATVAVDNNWALDRIYPVVYVEDETTGEMSQSFSGTANLIPNTTTGTEVPKMVIVEHFTNTRCSVCASRNPGFYNNYNSSNSGDMIHLAIHPSRPYSSCVLNQHNSVQNDDRTKYYGVFGSTPRLVINGDVIPASASYNSPSLFTPYKGQTTPISLSLSQEFKGMDSIMVRVVAKVEATHSLGVQNLYVVLAEDTLFYNAPNGENEHFDVFRTSLFGNTGMQVTLPTNEGDSIVFEKTVGIHSDWEEERMFALAILQNDNDNEVTQSARLNAIGDNPNVNSITEMENRIGLNLFPNPVSELLNVRVDVNGIQDYQIISSNGIQVRRGEFEKELRFHTNELPFGLYYIVISNEQGVWTKQFVKSK